jgi:amidase
MTVKEQFSIAGLPTTWGHPKFRDWQPEVDAVVVQRLKAAGAIILGKTNVPVNLTDWQSYNDVYGTTNNPWNHGRTPGGSSGGSASALAAGFVPLELGSDIGGSLRAPAHFCGVFSHKPTLDLVPQRGSGPPQTPAIPVRGDLSVIGPMARSAADLAAELSVIAGPDELMEGVDYKLALPSPRREKLADYRVLVIDKHPLCPTASSVRAALNDLADRLSKTGCTVLRESPKLPDLALTSRVYRGLLAASFTADLPADVRARFEAEASALPADDQSLAASGLRGVTISHAEWIRQSRIRGGLRARWQALFQDVDVVLCPPMPTQAFPHDHHSPQNARNLEVDGTKNQSVWAGIAILTGLPSTTMPIAARRLADRHANHRRLFGRPHYDRVCRACRARVRRLQATTKPLRKLGHQALQPTHPGGRTSRAAPCQRPTMSLPDGRKACNTRYKNEVAQHRDDTHTH